VARERELPTIVAHASAASERESEPRVRTHAAVVARAHSIKRRSRGFFELTHDTLAALHSVRTHDRFVFEPSLPWTVRPDCASTFWTVQIVGGGEIAESVMGIEHTAASRPWTVQIVGGGGGGEIAESLTGVEHGPKCSFMAFQRSRLWEGDLQNP